MFIGLVSSENYYRRPRLILHNNYTNGIRVGYDRVEQIREGVLGDGLEGNFWEEDCQRVSSRNVNVSTDVAVTISSGSLFQYGTTRTLNACWQQRVLHRSPMRVEASKTALDGKLRRPCIIFYMQMRSPRRAAAGGLSRMGRGAATLQTSLRVLNTF